MATFSIQNKNFSRDDNSNQSFKRSKGSRVPEYTDCKLHFENIPGQKEQWRSETNFRFTRLQQAYEGKKISTYLTPKDFTIFAGRRLVGSLRHFSSLPSCTDRTLTSTSIESNLQRRITSDDEPALHPLICPTDLCDHHELDCGNPSCARNEGSCLLGRFPHCLTRHEQIDRASKISNQSARIPGLESQSSKECHKPLPDFGIFVCDLGHSAQSDSFTYVKGKKDCVSDKRDDHKLELYSKITAVSPRVLKFRKLHHLQRSSSLPPSSKVSHDLPSEQTSVEKFNPLYGIRGSEVVARSNSFNFPSPQKQDQSLSVHRRCRLWMGSSIKRDPYFGNLDDRPTQMAFEQKRNVCPISSSNPPVPQTSGISRFSSDGQYNSSSLYTEGGRNQIVRTLQPDI